MVKKSFANAYVFYLLANTFFSLDWDTLEENARQADDRKAAKRGPDYEDEAPRKKGRR
jgi:hypothetical protein